MTQQLQDAPALGVLLQLLPVDGLEPEQRGLGAAEEAAEEEQGGDDDARDERTQKCLQPELFTGNTT